MEFRHKLLRWYESSKRDLPWRRDYTPYAVWISEVMLQQTQVKTVIPYFLRWMERFPDVIALSRAPREEVLKYWEGLGYYSRAENIHKTAILISEEHNGEFPTSHAQLLKLPGIGPYTAGAIMSFAYNKEYPVVDVNIERVLVRILNIDGDLRERQTKRRIWNAAAELIPQGRARLFNQALMELGATICVARNPLCSKCPVNSFCESFRLDVVDQRPRPKERKTPTPIEVALGVLAENGEVFVQKRPSSGLMPGLWEFPGGKLLEGETPEEALVREFSEELELNIQPVAKITVIRHSYTSFRVTLHAFLCRLVDGARTPVLHAAVEARWVRPDELSRYAFPAANRRLIELLMQKGLQGASGFGPQVSS